MTEIRSTGLFNFSEFDKTAWINERDGLYKDLITGKVMEAAGCEYPGLWILLAEKAVKRHEMEIQIL